MSSGDKARSPRKAAADILFAVDRKGAYSNLALNALSDLPEQDASFARRIVLGVLEKEVLLDAVLDRYVRKRPDPMTRILLREGLYQILYMDRVPESAACNETVAIAKERFGDAKAGFINAVLRASVREKEQILSSVPSYPPHVRHSVSEGIVFMLKEQYPDEWEDILDAFDRHPPLFVRCNQLRVSPGSLAEMLSGEADGTRIRVDDRQSEAIRKTKEGLCFPQGYGSQEAVRMLGAGEGELVVDVCACPGGKSFGAALDMRNTGKVFSFDIHPNKLSAIKNGANLLGLTNLAVAERNAETPDEKLLSQADRVIVDVPCSGLGEICAKPEIRKKDPAEFGGLYRTQAAILNASADYVKPGGVLVYSTCTINKKENECRVQAFLACRTDFRLTDEKVFLPTGAACEGFYAARLEKMR